MASGGLPIEEMHASRGGEGVDRIYLYEPGLKRSKPRSTVAAAALSFWQLLAAWSLFGLVAQPVCLTRANCLTSSD